MTIERVELKHFFLSFLDKIPIRIILPSSGSRGALLEASRGGVGIAAPAGMRETFPRALGRPWVAVRAHYGALPETAGLGQAKAGKPAEATSQEARPQGQKSPRWRAVRRCAVAACRRSGGADRDRNHPLRLTARCHPSCFEGDCSHLGRASAARLRERGCLKFRNRKVDRAPCVGPHHVRLRQTSFGLLSSTGA